MKKNLIPMTAFIVVAVFAASVFSEDPKPQRAKSRPERPGVNTSRSVPGAGMQRTKGTPQGSRSIEAFKEQQAKRVEAEIKRINAAHEAEITLFQAILKQANDENAPKTAAMLSELIEKKKEENKATVKKIQDRIEEFNKRMQRSPRSRDTRPDSRAPLSRPSRGAISTKPRTANPAEKK